MPFMGKKDSKDEAKAEQSKKDRKAVADAAPKKKAEALTTQKQREQEKSPEELKGEELDKAAKKADVEGRSQMTADEKREAIAEKTGSSSQHTRQTAVDPGRSEERERERQKVAEKRAKDNPSTPGYRDYHAIVDDAPSKTGPAPVNRAAEAKEAESKSGSRSKKDEPPEAKTVETVDIEEGDAHGVLVVDKTRYRLSPVQVAYLTKGLVHLNNNLHVPSDA